MNERPPLPPGPFLVVGLARSGRAAALKLAELGQVVRGVDSGEVPDETLAELEDAGVEVHASAAGVDLLPGTRTVVKSPGVPQEVPVIVAARERGLLVVGELEIAWRLLPNDFIAVTGSNGKTTTVELLGHVHREAGLPVVVAGNVGTPLASLPGTIDEDATIVCEASSFQLEDTELFAPEAAVLLNITEDHLDRHHTMDAYRAAKLQVFARQANEAIAVAPLGLRIEDLGGCARRVCFGRAPGAELAEREGWFWWDEEPFMAIDELRIRGEHNRENAMATAAVCLARGMDPQTLRAGLASFKGVAHRLEEVARIGGVTYVNDSKATNVASAVVALNSFEPGTVHVILGGLGKGADFAPLAGPVARHCRTVQLIGQAAPEIAAAIGSPPDTEIHHAGDLPTALRAAREAARDGDTILLAPACASFDQFDSFEHRGDTFRTLVGQMT